MMPARVEKKVASRMGTNTSVGCAAPIWARYTMMLIGISVSPDQGSAKGRHVYQAVARRTNT